MVDRSNLSVATNVQRSTLSTMNRQIALAYLTALMQYFNIAIHALPLPTPISLTFRPDETRAALRNGALLYLILVIILGSSVTVTLLLVTKWIYISRRYRQPGYTSGMTDLSARPLWNGSIYGGTQHNTRMRSSDEKGKSGILVGLFGSPSWETRYSTLIDAVSEQVSFTRTRHTASTCSSHLVHCFSEQQARASRSKCLDKDVACTQHGCDVSERQSPRIDEKSRLSSGLKVPPLALVKVIHPRVYGDTHLPVADSTCRGISFIELPKAALLSPLPRISSWNPAVTKAKDSQAFLPHQAFYPEHPQLNPDNQDNSMLTVSGHGIAASDFCSMQNPTSYENRLCSNNRLPQRELTNCAFPHVQTS